MTEPTKLSKSDGTLVKSEAARGYIYRVVTAAIPILTVWGVVADTEVPLYLGLLAAILGIPLAAINTSIKKGN